MPVLIRHFLVCLLCLGSAQAAKTRLSTDKPVINFRLPAFTPDGNRDWLVRGSEARYLSDELINIKELTLTVFTGQPDGAVDTLILSPLAEVRPASSLNDSVVSGPSSIRVINDQLEASGIGWVFQPKDKRVSIAKNVRVVFRAEMKDLIK